VHDCPKEFLFDHYKGSTLPCKVNQSGFGLGVFFNGSNLSFSRVKLIIKSEHAVKKTPTTKPNPTNKMLYHVYHI
jgi:hypothetical protein